MDKICLSEAAANQIKLQLEKRGTPNASLRLGVKGGGCSGFTYILEFEDSQPRIKDEVSYQHNIKIVIDKKSLIFLNGSTLDWKKSLMNQGFKFINPNEESRCGCGLSFTVKDHDDSRNLSEKSPKE